MKSLSGPMQTLLVLLAVPAWSQITMNRSYFDDLRERLTGYTNYEAANAAALQAAADAAGGNQTYDFTAATFTADLQATMEYLPFPADVPSADDPAFAEADFVIYQSFADSSAADSTIWSFIRLEEGGMFNLGMSLLADLDEDGTPDPFTFKFNPHRQDLKFPLTFGTTWSQTVNMASDFFSQPSTSTYEVDGWGTLVTPSGSAPCLRLRHVMETTIPFIGGVQRTTTLNFLTLGELSASITLDAGGKPREATYQVFALSDGGTGDNGSGQPDADFNGDGQVDFADFFLFADAFNGTDPDFDLSGDGQVDFADFFLFADAFGK